MVVNGRRRGAPWVLVHEYDPLLQQKDTIKYRINSLNDPTKRDMYKTLKVGGGVVQVALD